MYCKLRRLELLRQGQQSDCELVVWPKDKYAKEYCRQFKCHKLMLTSASEVFDQMIREMEFNKYKPVINVNDASPEAYETLLLYIYTYDIYNYITIDMCPDLVYLATKYKMPDFIDGYISKLINTNWPLNTVVKIFQLATEHNRPDVLKLVSKKMVGLASELLDKKVFLKSSIKELYALMFILKDAGTVSDKKLLLALGEYQQFNKLYYNNMALFQEFVEVTKLFGDRLFEPNGTLALQAVKQDAKYGVPAKKQAKAAKPIESALTVKRKSVEAKSQTSVKHQHQRFKNKTETFKHSKTLTKAAKKQTEIFNDQSESSKEKTNFNRMKKRRLFQNSRSF